MNRRFVPVLVAGLLVLSVLAAALRPQAKKAKRTAALLVSTVLVATVLAGCIGDGKGKSDAKLEDGNGGGARVELSADAGAIEGIVTDVSFSEFFVGALIAVTTDGAKIIQNATTDDLGQFFVGGLAPGEYKVFASYADHRPQGKTVNVVAGQAATVNFALVALPRVEPRAVEIPLNFFISCGFGLVSEGEGNVQCGSRDAGQVHKKEFPVEQGLTVLVVAAKWSGTCVGCSDQKPWLVFKLQSPAKTTYDFWRSAGPEMVKRYEFNLTEESVAFTTGNWTLQVLPAGGNSSTQYQTERGGLVQQTKIEAWVTAAYDNYYLPPEYSGLPDQ